ncbi:MAG: Maf family nucleotide pyrophosphatase [Flavobacteriaceae bacterium]|jgi:septum formation protein|nr:Maf family nucleotide pyrophosphatase [Flavobacteriaceae bacterium]
MLADKLKKYHLILASASPRRQQLLRDLGFDFEVRLKEIEEIYPKNLKAEEITNYLAELKAKAFENELSNNDILITSDTIVWHEEKALEKPKNKTEAFEMLKSLSGKTHKIISSVCLKRTEETLTFFDVTYVTFLHLNEEEIEYYIEQFKPFDKAGAYGIQEWIGLIGVSKIEGSYTNVVGLPTHLIYKNLILR